MNDNPLVTIIISIYNGELYLEKCLNSVLEQDYKNYEVIMIDDGSKDGSGKIADRFVALDERFSVIHKKNEGVSKSRNRGIDIAKGDYICIVDQDDILRKDFLSYHLNLLKEKDASISLVPQVIKYTEESSNYSEQKSENLIEVWTGEKAAIQMLYANVEIGPWNKLISKKLIEKNNIRFHEELFGGEGYAFSVECFQCADRVAVGYKGVYCYRIDNNTSGMSIYRSSVANSSIKAINIMEKGMCLHTKNMKNALKYARWNVYFVMLIIMRRSKAEGENGDQYNRFLKQCRKYPFSANFGPLTIKRKIKGMLCWISPKISIYISTRKKSDREYDGK